MPQNIKLVASTVEVSDVVGHTVPMHIPETIGGLLHLRYLHLSGNDELKELPSTMASLYNLQTWRLVGCSGLKKGDVGRLMNY